MKNSRNSWKTSASHILRQIQRCFFPLLVLISIVGFFSGYGWIFNVCSHFPAQYTLLFAVCLFWYLKKKQFLQVAVCVVLMAINLSELAPYLTPASNAEKADAGRTTIRFMQMNLFVQNDQFEKIATSINEQTPDLIAFEEFNDRIYNGLKSQHVIEQYPHSVVIPNPFPHSEIALFSKLPIQSYRVEYAVEHKDPSIIAHLNLSSGKDLTVIVLHPRPPASPYFLDRQIKQLEFVAAKRPEFGTNIVVLGDLNTTPWAAPYKNLVKTMGLVDTRIGRGVLPTWPSYVPVFLIPIDHILASPGIHVSKLGVGSFTASDHLPLVMDCSL